MGFRELFGRLGYWALVKSMALRDRQRAMDAFLDRGIRGLEIVALQEEFGINVHEARAALDEAPCFGAPGSRFERARGVCHDATALGLSVRCFVERRRTLSVFPCGCSRMKVDGGRCDVYAPSELPDAHTTEAHQCRR